MNENYFTLSRRYKCSKCYEAHMKWKSDLQRVATEQGARIEFVGDEQVCSQPVRVTHEKYYSYFF